MEILLSTMATGAKKWAFTRGAAHVIDESSVKEIENIEVGIKCSA